MIMKALRGSLDFIPDRRSIEHVSIPEGRPPAEDVDEGCRGYSNKKRMVFALGTFAVVSILCTVIPTTSFDSLVGKQTEIYPSNKAGVHLPLREHVARKTQDAATTSTMKEEIPPESETAVEDPFAGIDLNLPYFSRNVTKGYVNEEDFDAAITKALMLLVKQRYEREQSQPVYATVASSGMEFAESAVMERPMASMAADAADESSSFGSGGGGDTGGLTDFGTNNQEVGVDEADIIKADANYMYAAYGDYIVVWDTDGNKITEVAMPALPRVYYESYMNIDGEQSFYQPKAYIQALLLNSGFLTVVVSGYSDVMKEAAGMTEPTILYEYLSTHIRTYKTSNLPTTGELEYVGMKNVNGRYLDGRSIGGNVHIVTVSGIDVYRGLFYHFNGNMKENLNAIQERIVPEFARRLREEIFSVSGDVTDMLQINRWKTDSPENPEIENLLVNEDVVSNVAWVTSFDVNEAPISNLEGQGEELSVSTTTFMSPSSWMHMYGNTEKLVLATQGWNWNRNVEGEQQTTYLLALSVDGPSTSFVSVGTVAGHLLNQFALDIVGNDLRVATTLRTRRFFGFPFPMPFPVEEVAEISEEETNETEIEMATTTDEIPETIVLPEEATSSMVAPIVAMASSSMVNAAEPMVQASSSVAEPAVTNSMAENATNDSGIEPAEIEADIAYVTPFPPTNVRPQIESSTENYVIVLDLERDDRPGEIVERGRVKVGEINESITAVRFFDDFAYVVTFERTDPFYVIDLQTPSKLGEFKLNGFSSYLHPMNSDNTLLIGIGQDATDEGRTTGLMITVFDATIPSAPTVLVNYTLSDNRAGSSNSAVQWEHKAFRYIDGHLIIPVSDYHYVFNEQTGEVEQHTFEGFTVFEVTTTVIDEKFRVSMFDRHCHYCSGYLPQRSFIYDGNLVTVQNNNVKSTNLVSGIRTWTMDIVIDGEENTCCPYYM